MKNEQLYNYILTIADNSLILAQRLGELCGHGPNLETDIALTNIALDLLGQTRSYYQYAAKISGGDKMSIKNLKKRHDELGMILAKIQDGDEFEELAKQHSEDATAQKGGDLGWFQPGQMVPAFEEAAFKLEIGEVSALRPGLAFPVQRKAPEFQPIQVGVPQGHPAVDDRYQRLG